MDAKHQTDVVELVPSRLYVVGGGIELDGRVSWAPKIAGAWQPLNCYVLREDDAFLLIDPGPSVHQEILIRQLKSIVPRGSSVSVFATRAELDAFGSLGAIANNFHVEHLYAGGFMNPFDAFDNIMNVDLAAINADIALVRHSTGSSIPIKGDRSIMVLRPALRLLATFWIYDSLTRTLFTSDVFGHGTIENGTSARTIGTEAFDIQKVRDHLFTKFWWLPLAKKKISGVSSDLRAIFLQNQVDIIAPSHGCVIVGPDAVSQHYALVQEVLSAVERDG